MTEWQPLNDRILVRMIKEPERGMIAIPDKYKSSPHIGMIIATGPGRWVEGVNPGLVRRPLDVKPGQMVAFGRFTDYDFEDRVLIQEADIMFVIDAPVKIGIEKFTHMDVGVDQVAGSGVLK